MRQRAWPIRNVSHLNAKTGVKISSMILVSATKSISADVTMEQMETSNTMFITNLKLVIRPKTTPHLDLTTEVKDIISRMLIGNVDHLNVENGAKISCTNLGNATAMTADVTTKEVINMMNITIERPATRVI